MSIIVQNVNPFIRGDANGDGEVAVSDAVKILLYLFGRGTMLPVADVDDVDDDGRIAITDAIILLNHLFKGGPSPAAPFPIPGVDPTPDQLP